MMQKIIILYLCSICVWELTGAPTEQQNNHGPITPKLTLVAIVDGKAFFYDRTTSTRNRTQALAYCESLGMRLAEITSANQFSAIDKAVVEEWPDRYCAWTGGIEVRGIRRYAWERTNVSLDSSNIPYRSAFEKNSNYFLFFKKYITGSYLENVVATTTCNGVLCESLMNK